VSDALRQHGLSITLVALWLALLGASMAVDPTEWFGNALINHAADTFGAAIIVIFSKYLYERGSPASKPPPEE
jgi:hypothetical protein